MSSPVGHALAGGILVCAGRSCRRIPPLSVLLVGMVIANAPDLDFIPGFILGQPNLYHHGISHSLGAAVFLALLWTFFVNRLLHWRVYIGGFQFFCLYSSHLLLDLLSRDGRPPYGIPLFWPLSGKYCMIPLLPAVSHSQYDHATISMVLHDIFSPHNMYVIGLEILLVLPLFLAVLLWNRHRQKRT